jgi:LacI family transcriptional regulator
MFQGSDATGRRVGVMIDVDLLYKHHTGVFAGIEQYAENAGWTTILDDWVEGPLARATPEQRVYDGVIARVDAKRLGAIDAAARLGIPLVNVLLGSPAVDRLPGVFPDFDHVGRLQAEHLMARGLSRFAFAFVKRRAPDERQAAAFTAHVKAAGHSITTFAWRQKRSSSLEIHDAWIASIEKWMNGWHLPVGVATVSDFVARILAQLCHGRGWRVPEDVAIIGGRNEEQLCDRPRPGLSSIECGFERVGYEAAKMLDRLMDEGEGVEAGHASATLEHVILPPVGVVLRESTDRYASTDPVVAEAQAYIFEQCHTHLDVSTVAEKLLVSPRTLQNHFAAHLKRSVGQEIRRVRLERAKQELATTDRAVHEIAVRAGFGSNARLCEVFKREVGMSPSEYREQRQVKRER